jgi:hypothetical protein
MRLESEIGNRNIMDSGIWVNLTNERGISPAGKRCYPLAPSLTP